MVAESDCEVKKILNEISGHLESLENELRCYFTELKDLESTLTCSPFSASLDVASIPDDLQTIDIACLSSFSCYIFFKEWIFNISPLKKKKEIEF